MKKLLSKFDIFAALPTLRAEGESEVVNLCGSLFSIAIFAAFVYLFVASMISTLNYQKIDSREILTMNRPAHQPITNITVGVGIQFSSLLKLRSIFELRAFLGDRSLEFRPIDVFPCERDMWADLDDTKYKTLNLENHMCIQKKNIEIYGEFGSPEVQFIVLNLSVCSNVTSPVPCASPAFITWFFTNKMLWGRFIPTSLIILDTGISATNVNPLTFNPYQKTQFLLFNQKQQMFIQAFIGTYEINTDKSFLPFEQKTQIRGHFVTQCTMTTVINYLNTPALLDVYIFPSPVHKIITRSYGKFDSILSYVGGLYGIVVSFLGLLFMSFNQYRYELRVSEGAFSLKHGHISRQKDLNFLKYLKYSLYSWITTLTCLKPNWPDCKQISQSREQAIQQIDIKHLLHRISHLENVISTLINSNGEISMYMIESNSIDEVKRRRNIVEYCARLGGVEGNGGGITIQGFDQLDMIVGFSLGQFAKTESSLMFPTFDQDDKNNDLRNQRFGKSQSSLELMQKYLKKYVSRFSINQHSFQSTQNDLKAEQDLTQSFFNLDEQTRMKIIRKIPLALLYRLNNAHNRKQHNPKENNDKDTEIFVELVTHDTSKSKLGNSKRRGERRRSRDKLVVQDING